MLMLSDLKLNASDVAYVNDFEGVKVCFFHSIHTKNLIKSSIINGSEHRLRGFQQLIAENLYLLATKYFLNNVVD